MNSIIYGNLGNGAVVDLTPYINLGNTNSALITAVSNAFFRGFMPTTMQTDISGALTSITGTTTTAEKARAQAALYLGLTSSYYNIEH